MARKKPKKVFISYRHAVQEWVKDRLVPCLEAGGARVLIDREEFEAGKQVTSEMDKTQNKADVHILVISDGYADSKYCRHEMDLALEADSDASKGTVVPVLRDHSQLPAELKKQDRLVVDLTRAVKGAARKDQWDLLLDACDADLGVSAPEWIKARDQSRRFLRRNQSVNLVVSHEVAWRALIRNLIEDDSTALEKKLVDLNKPRTTSRRGLVAEILECCGHKLPVPPAPEDLGALGYALDRPGVTRLVMTHFDMVPYRDSYGVDLFAALRYLLMEEKKLVLLIQSVSPFAKLVPRENPLSAIDLKTIELEGRTA